MSSRASDVLKKIKDDAAKRAPVDPESFYARLMINRQRRSLLVVAAHVFFVFAFVLLVRDMRADRHWLLTALPVVGAGLLLALLPLSEDWDYKPWQTQPRQYEKHQAERWRKE